MATEKKCFIIMPITTPDMFLDKYRDGKGHFEHVLNCLFVPSIKKAGFVPNPPKAKGSDIIHENIIKNLEAADLVLCDMSCLNPNVFFEFGVRTSLNKPVCVVKDGLTDNVPFDTSIINYQEYKSTLDPWELDSEIEKLSEHIKTSAEKSKGENTMWKVFGLKSTAVPYEVKGGTDEKLDYLALQIESMRDKVDFLSQYELTYEGPTIGTTGPGERVTEEQKILSLIELTTPDDVKVITIYFPALNKAVICYKGEWNRAARNVLDKVAEGMGFSISWQRQRGASIEDL